MQSKCPCRKDSEHLRGFDEKHGTAHVLQRMLWMLLEVSRATRREAEGNWKGISYATYLPCPKNAKSAMRKSRGRGDTGDAVVSTLVKRSCHENPCWPPALSGPWTRRFGAADGRERPMGASGRVARDPSALVEL